MARRYERTWKTNDSKNKLLIEIDGEIRTLELEPNYYNRNELVEFLNEGLEIPSTQ